MNAFFEWAYRTRGNSVRDLAEGKEVSMEKMFLSFMSHNPIFVSDGPAGLNGAVKGIGFIPREEYLAEAMEAYKKHIQSYVKGDRSYSERGLQILLKYLYSEEAEKTIDFDHVYGVNSNRYLAELTLQPGLKSIGKEAFSYSKRLTTVTIPNGVTTIGEEAFAHCWTQLPKSDSFTGLTTVTIPGSVTSIGKNAFTDNQQLTTVNFDGTQEQWNAAGGKNAGVPSSATFHCVKVAASGSCGTGVKWSLASNGVLTITGTGKGIMKDYAEGSTKPWESNGDIKQIIICEGITHIGDHAFANSPATRVSLPESLTSIGTRAFAGAAITAMTIPGSVTTIGVEVFWGCSELTSLTICDGVTAIESAFGKCTGLTELVLPDSVTTIGTQAFYRCTGLRTVTLSKNLISIGYMAFSGCTGLTDLVFPDSLKEIDQEAFRYCSGLNSISLGTGLTTIGRMAFDGCDPTAVDYRGTQKEWNSIAIGNKNDCLSRVTCIKLGVIVTDGDTPDVTDVASLYDHLTGQADTAYTPRQELSADVNRDGTLDVYDLQLLYEAVAQGTEL